MTLVDRSDDLFRVDGVTISRGGPCWPGFMLMREPYKGPYGELTRGVSFIPKEWCELAMRFAAEHRLRLNVVVAGSGEHDEYLDQLEAVDRDHGIKGRHWIMQHAFFVDERAGPALRRARHRRHDQHVVLVGQGRHVHRAHGRARAEGSDPAPPHARRRLSRRVRQRLGTEERLRARRTRDDPRVLRQRAAERRPGAGGDARRVARDVDARGGARAAVGRGRARSPSATTPT